MSSIPSNWNEKADITWREYFNPPWMLPHIGIVKLGKALEEKYGKERSHRILDEVSGNLCEEVISRIKGDDVVESFQDAMDVLGKFLNTYPEFEIAHESEVIEVTDSKSVLNIKKCIWADAFRSMDAQEIGFIWNCKQDFRLASSINPRFKLKRSKTLMQGDDCCNFTWYWEEE
jgi:hypothetical protein